jgi:RNA polymerase sigma factor (sigma-70 family)
MDPSQRGDEAELFASFNNELVRKVARAVRTSAANVEDGCAFAWAQFLRYQPDRERNWRGWLVRVAAREALHLHIDERDVVHVAPSEGQGAGVLPEVPDTRPSPQLQHLELRDALGVVSRIPQRRREVAVLRLIGLKYSEIGKALGLSYSQVNRLLTEADAHIREEIARVRAGSERPRVARLHELEDEPPKWLTKYIGRSPAHPAARLAWRRAALVLDDLRTQIGEEPLLDGLKSATVPLESCSDFDRARDVIAKAREAKAMSRAPGLER